MQNQLIEIIEAMQQHAKTCETVAQDKTEEALTGESSEKEKNTQDAIEWMIRSKVWLEAEAVVRGIAEPPPQLPPAAILPLDSPTSAS